ncbi:MAG: acyltransferase family protein [Mycobacterium sp.]|jgi:1-acyl-sn-glycerol-3-phosphate acyltransferase|uniref:lysophospholipid acyltransferase family protein n=1 Tax=Mycobacterium sp. TaxID=1785 RepID=UPI001D724D4C|nr:acyltransferase family protein [Mycobacterium sp.]
MHRPIDSWDPAAARQFVEALAPIARRWFRSEVRGLAEFPQSGGVLVVSNHSGGMMTPDVLIFAAAFYHELGYDRPLYTLGHDLLFTGPLTDWLTRIGVIPANRDTAAQALRSGGVVLVFPGGVYDAYRPTLTENVIDFNGHTGYVRTAIEAGVPIVPAVSIGGQESQLFLTRGSWLAKRLGLKRFRSDILPVSVGFPFGLSVVVPPNVPLPTKIVVQALGAIDINAGFGEDPDIDEVDGHVRSMMQSALDGLARERRFPVLG